jgi:hypothetical protein
VTRREDPLVNCFSPGCGFKVKNVTLVTIDQHIANTDSAIKAAVRSGDFTQAQTLISRKVGLKQVRGMLCASTH